VYARHTCATVTLRHGWSQLPHFMCTTSLVIETIGKFSGIAFVTMLAVDRWAGRGTQPHIQMQVLAPVSRDRVSAHSRAPVHVHIDDDHVDIGGRVCCAHLRVHGSGTYCCVSVHTQLPHAHPGEHAQTKQHAGCVPVHDAHAVAGHAVCVHTVPLVDVHSCANLQPYSSLTFTLTVPL
jgi:hypothetical protein